MAIEPERYLPLQQLHRRIRWLISLRWIAIACLFAVITISVVILQVSLPVVPLYSCNAALLLANIGYVFLLRGRRDETGTAFSPRRINVLINLQISLDLVLLACLLYFSGGIANPFIMFFIFHMVIASILLSNRAAYIQASLVVCLFALLAAGEAWSFLAAFPLGALITARSVSSSVLYLAGLFVAFTAAIYITVYMTTSIVNALRKRERDLEAAIDRLEIAKSRLEHKDREKSQYVLTVSHDIKGSLSSIQSCLRVVLDGLVGTVTEKAQGMVCRAERRSLSLLRYVDELLYISTLRSGDVIRKRNIVPARVVGRVVEALGPLAAEKGIELEISDRSGSIEVSADPDMLEELARQLLDNAVKYTPSGGRIAVELQIVEQGSQVLMSVADTGTGIDARDLPHLFEDFYFADTSVNKETASTGLGLAIVKQITELHRGRIEAESVPSQGSTFRLYFPVSGKESEGGSANGKTSKNPDYRG